MKQKYGKPSFTLIKICLTDVLSTSGGLGEENFDHNWLPTIGQNS